MFGCPCQRREVHREADLSLGRAPALRQLPDRRDLLEKIPHLHQTETAGEALSAMESGENELLLFGSSDLTRRCDPLPHPCPGDH